MALRRRWRRRALEAEAQQEKGIVEQQAQQHVAGFSPLLSGALSGALSPTRQLSLRSLPSLRSPSLRSASSGLGEGSPRRIQFVETSPPLPPAPETSPTRLSLLSLSPLRSVTSLCLRQEGSEAPEIVITLPAVADSESIYDSTGDCLFCPSFRFPANWFKWRRRKKQREDKEQIDEWIEVEAKDIPGEHSGATESPSSAKWSIFKRRQRKRGP